MSSHTRHGRNAQGHTPPRCWPTTQPCASGPLGLPGCRLFSGLVSSLLALLGAATSLPTKPLILQLAKVCFHCYNQNTLLVDQLSLSWTTSHQFKTASFKVCETRTGVCVDTHVHTYTYMDGKPHNQQAITSCCDPGGRQAAAPRAGALGQAPSAQCAACCGAHALPSPRCHHFTDAKLHRDTAQTRIQAFSEVKTKDQY